MRINDFTPDVLDVDNDDAHHGAFYVVIKSSRAAISLTTVPGKSSANATLIDATGFAESLASLPSLQGKVAKDEDEGVTVEVTS